MRSKREASEVRTIAPTFADALVIHAARANVRRQLVARRRPADGGGLWMGIACVLLAIILYVVVTAVWGSGDAGEMSNLAAKVERLA